MRKMILVKMAGLSTALLLASLLLSACGSGGGGGHGGEGQPVSPEKPVPEKTDKNKEKTNPDSGKVKPAAPEPEIKPVPPAVKPEGKPGTEKEPPPEVNPGDKDKANPDTGPVKPADPEPEEKPVVKPAPEEKPADPADKEKPPVGGEGKEDKDNPPEGNGAEPVAPDAKPAEKPADKVARYEGRMVEYISKGNSFLSDDHLSVTKQDPTLTATGKYFVFTVNADGKEAKVVANSEMQPEMTSIELSDAYPAEMQAFIDRETAKLVGFYGQAVGRMEGLNNDTRIEDTFNVASMAYFADESMKKRPDTDAHYQGKFLYYHLNSPKTAAVNIHYRDQKVTGDIHRNDSEHWNISGETQVNDEGGFSVKLISQDQKYVENGTLNGGFYGQHGEFLLGSAKSNDEGQQWSGVIGAEKTAQPAVAAH